MTNARSFGAPSQEATCRLEAIDAAGGSPKRPGEYGPDDVGKKGGALVENPNIEGPTDIPTRVATSATPADLRRQLNST
jgi:hypothetical protein